MEKDLIKKINKKCPCGQGVFFQPFGIPDGIMEHVIYSSYETGGVQGGSCWESSNPQPYSVDAPNNGMEVLDIVLTEIAPDITFLQYKKIKALIKSNIKTEWGYYGNHTDSVIEYILVSEFEDLLKEIRSQ